MALEAPSLPRRSCMGPMVCVVNVDVDVVLGSGPSGPEKGFHCLKSEPFCLSES